MTLKQKIIILGCSIALIAGAPLFAKPKMVSVAVFVPGIVKGNPTYELLVEGVQAAKAQLDKKGKPVTVKVVEGGVNQGEWQNGLTALAFFPVPSLCALTGGWWADPSRFLSVLVLVVGVLAAVDDAEPPVRLQQDRVGVVGGQDEHAGLAGRRLEGVRRAGLGHGGLRAVPGRRHRRADHCCSRQGEGSRPRHPSPRRHRASTRRRSHPTLTHSGPGHEDGGAPMRCV